MYLIVDAMDESDETERREIVRLLWNLTDSTNSKCTVKVFLASRPINELHHGVIGGYRIRLQDKNMGDIKTYVPYGEQPVTACNLEHSGPRPGDGLHLGSPSATLEVLPDPGLCLDACKYKE
jgi:hypothetical protein